MPKVDINLLDEVSVRVCGTLLPLGSGRTDVAQRNAFLKQAGISKGQWKRARLASNTGFGFAVSELAIKKLKVMAEHGQSPHLTTLLKMVEVQESCDDTD